MIPIKTSFNSRIVCKDKILFKIALSAFSSSAAAESDVAPSEMKDGISLQDGEQEIDKIRDKSRLKSPHRNILFGMKPYSQPMIKAHLTVKYNRKMYGKYGSDSGVNPGIMWPTKVDLEARKEYEKVAYPFTIEEMVKSAEAENRIKESEIEKNQQQIIHKLEKLAMWKKELKEKIAKKEAESLAAKEKKEKLIEDVRRHFGFTVDPKDERFKEMLALKEKEQKKKEKQARIEEKERKAIAKLMEIKEVASK